MRYPVFLAMSIFLMVVQTAIIVELSGAISFYDLLIPLVVYFSLYRPFSEGLFILLAAGMMTDMVSGAPHGVYPTVYLWLFLAFRRTRRWIRIKQNILFPVIVIIGVLFENTVFWISISMQSGRFVFSAPALKILFFQLLWAVITTPILFILFHAVFSAADRLGARKLPEDG